jgi:GTP-binding protein
VEPVPLDGSDPLDNAHAIERELEAYSRALAERPIWMVLSKSDLVTDDECQQLLDRFAAAWPDRPLFSVSGLSGAGLPELAASLMTALREADTRRREDADFAAAEAAREAAIGADVLASSLARRGAADNDDLLDDAPDDAPDEDDVEIIHVR